MYRAIKSNGCEIITTMTSVAEVLSNGFIPVNPITWETIYDDVSYEGFANGEIDFIRKEY